MENAQARSRRWKILAAVPIGILLFVIALFSTGAGHGSYWAVIVFFPLQVVTAALLQGAVGGGLSDGVFIGIAAVLSLAWYPLLVFLFTATQRSYRVLAIALLVFQAAAGALIALNL